MRTTTTDARPRMDAAEPLRPDPSRVLKTLLVAFDGRRLAVALGDLLRMTGGRRTPIARSLERGGSR
jgi:hypothetical protein